MIISFSTIFTQDNVEDSPIQGVNYEISNDELFYQESNVFFGSSKIFFSSWEGNSQAILESRDEYCTALQRFLNIVASYRNSLSISFAMRHDLYTRDLLGEIKTALDSSLEIILINKGEDSSLWHDRKVLLLTHYITIQDNLREYLYLLNTSNQFSGAIITIMLCVFSVLTLLALIFFIKYAKNQLMFSQLEKRVSEQKLVVKIQEDERERMGVELHDTVAQDIKVLKIFIAQLEPQVRASEENQKLLEKIHQLETHSLTSLYSILNRLVPPELDSMDFKGVLLSLCNDFIRSSGLECVFYMEPGTRINDLSGETRLQVFRIVQEALTNVEHHSEASSCTITIREQDNRIIMFISDDGVGLDSTQENKNQNYGGFGLRGMEARVALVGGDFKIRWDEEGTEIRLEIPIA